MEHISIKKLLHHIGYLLDNTTHTLTFSDEGEDNSNLSSSETLINKEPTGSLTLVKSDSLTGNSMRIDNSYHHGDASLDGAVYTLYASGRITNHAGTRTYFNSGDAVATFTFDERGNATVSLISYTGKLRANGSTLEGIPLGAYHLEETTVPTGYTKDTRTYNYTFTYRDQYTPVISKYGYVYNSVKTEPFEIIKVSTDTNDTAELIENAEFTVILKKYVQYYGSFDEALKHTDEYAFDEWCTITTDKKGYAISDRLAYGTYVVRETHIPSDTLIGVKDFEITLTNDSATPTQSWKVENDLPFSAWFKLVKRDELSNKTVIFSNATFQLYKLNENTSEWEQVRCKVGKDYYTTWTTDEEGIAYTENKLHYGTYKLTEIKTPDGFNELDYDVIFRVSASNPTCEYDIDGDAWITVDVINLQPTGTLTINKKVEEIDENSGYTYLAEEIDYSKIKFKLTADENIIDYSDGSYYYDKDEVVGIYSVSEDGTLTIEGLPMGKYRLEEIETLDGYVLDEKIYKFEFKQVDTVTKVYEYTLNLQNYMTTTEFSKININKELIENCTLELWRETEVDGENNYELLDTWVTNDKSHIIKGLSVGGKYILKEVAVAEPYVLAKDIEFTTENVVKIQEIEMIDKIVEMSKQNIAGKEIEGAELKVVDKYGNIIDSWISTIEPHKIKGLKEGETYTLYEDYAPNGYVIATEIEFTVTLEKENQRVEMIDKVVELSKQNIAGEELKGATLVVTNTKTKNIVDKWTSDGTPHKISGLIEGETYVIHEEYAPYGYVLANDVEFTVTLDKNTQTVNMIDKQVFVSKTDIDGMELSGAYLQVVNERGNVVDSWVSSGAPHAVNGLEEGKTYTLIEEYAPDGYVIANEITFKVTEVKETQKVTMIDKVVEMSKQNIAGEEIEGAELKVVDKFGNIIDSWISTKEPHKIKGLKEGETYTLYEDYAPDGYVIATEIEFTVTLEKENQTVEMIDKILEMSKQNIAGEELEGATLVVTNTKTKNIVDKWTSDGTPHKISGLIEGETYVIHEEYAPYGYVLANDVEFTVRLDKETQKINMIDKQVIVSKIDEKGELLEGATLQVVDLEGNIIDEWVTTNDTHAVNDLVVGKTYILKEIDAPYKYLLADDMEFTVEDDNKIQTITMEDIPIQLELEIDKTGIIQAQPNDEIRYDFKTLINKSNVPLDNFTWEDNLPYEYITLTKLFTGTYNEDLDYDIFYKLVGNDEWVLFGTYNTMSNHCIDFTKIDGVVSDFKLCFETVKEGFSIVDAPFIYTKVNSTVKKDDTWTNYTKLTGDYTYRNGETEHLEDKAEWTTITYKHSLKVNNGVLPRSGDILSFILVLQTMLLISAILNITALLFILNKIFKNFFKSKK